MTVITLKNKNYQSTLTAPFDIDLGGMIPLSTTTLSSTASSVTFSNIPAYYEHLQIRGVAKNTDTNSGGVVIRGIFNSDTSTNYSYHAVGTYQGSSGASDYFGFPNAAFCYLGVMTNTHSSHTDIFGAIVLDILDYANTNKYKTTRSLAGYDMNGSTTGYNYLYLHSSAWRSTSAITSIQLFSPVGNFSQYSSFALYGIKKAGA
jgi:hypothetical protein